MFFPKGREPINKRDNQEKQSPKLAEPNGEGVEK